MDREKPEPMDDLNDILDALAAGWNSIAAQVSTIWIPMQLSLIVIAALVGWGIAVLIRRRIDLVSLTMGWPFYLRLGARTLIGNLGIIVCIVLLLAERAVMQAAT